MKGEREAPFIVGMEPLKAVIVTGETAGIGIEGIVSLKLVCSYLLC